MRDRKTILLVFGTRPETIKMAPLVKKLQSQPENFKTVVAVTGLHRQMLDQVLQIFDIVPDYDLNIMQANQDLYDVTSRVLVGMRDVLKEVQPDVVLVHGDTTTSTAAALAAFYQQIPVGHVEAGLINIISEGVKYGDVMNGCSPIRRLRRINDGHIYRMNSGRIL